MTILTLQAATHSLDRLHVKSSKAPASFPIYPLNFPALFNTYRFPATAGLRSSGHSPCLFRYHSHLYYPASPFASRPQSATSLWNWLFASRCLRNCSSGSPSSWDHLSSTVSRLFLHRQVCALPCRVESCSRSTIIIGVLGSSWILSLVCVR